MRIAGVCTTDLTCLKWKVLSQAPRDRPDLARPMDFADLLGVFGAREVEIWRCFGDVYLGNPTVSMSFLNSFSWIRTHEKRRVETLRQICRWAAGMLT